MRQILEKRRRVMMKLSIHKSCRLPTHFIGDDRRRAIQKARQRIQLARPVEHQVFVENNPPLISSSRSQNGADVPHPKATASRKVEVISFVQRFCNVRRVPKADHIPHHRYQLLPEGERKAGPRILPSPVERIRELSRNEPEGTLSHVL